ERSVIRNQVARVDDVVARQDIVDSDQAEIVARMNHRRGEVVPEGRIGIWQRNVQIYDPRGDRVDWKLNGGSGRRIPEYPLTLVQCGHLSELHVSDIQPLSLVCQHEECCVFPERAARCSAELMVAEPGRGLVRDLLEVIWRVQAPVAKELKAACMIIVRSRSGDYVDLAPGVVPEFGRTKAGDHLELLDRLD